MKIVETEVLSAEQKKSSLCQLWNNEYPSKLGIIKKEEFDVYLNGLSNTKHYLLIDDTDKIKGCIYF
jgi:hypothetical protein